MSWRAFSPISQICLAASEPLKESGAIIIFLYEILRCLYAVGFSLILFTEKALHLW